VIKSRKRRTRISQTTRGGGGKKKKGGDPAVPVLDQLLDKQKEESIDVIDRTPREEKGGKAVGDQKIIHFPEKRKKEEGGVRAQQGK